MTNNAEICAPEIFFPGGVDISTPAPAAAAPGTLLLVEDNPDDAFLLRRSLKKSGLNVLLQEVNDGEAALNYLRGHGDYADRSRYPIPTAILLDLKLPYMDGFEVLEWIRSHPALCEMDVLLLTSSAEERDARRATQLGVIEYLVKPPRPEVLSHAITPLLPGVQLGGSVPART